MKWLLWITFLAPAVQASQDLWDLAPVLYSDTQPTDALAVVAADLASGSTKVKGETELDRLRFVLKALHVPEESQILVFSKTSHQNSLIRPDNPRALFYSPDAYVGHVPGGKIEVIVQDAVLGPVFYVIGSGKDGGLDIERDTSDCIACHGTTATENVPGMQVRSVFADEDGRPLLSMGTTQVNHETPLSARWGGYYVTGKSPLPHLGNRVYQEGATPEPRPSDLTDLRDRIDVRKYLKPTSDIVALMVLEHQCQMHNLLTAASMQYRRARFLGQAIDVTGDPDAGSAGRVADFAADKIVDCLFFKNEADPGEDLAGSVEFQRVFEARFPRTADGRSLGDFQLYQHLFKYRCSYMVYSKAFSELPPRVMRAVLERMKRVLAGEDAHVDWLSSSERRKIAAILTETLPGW